MTDASATPQWIDVSQADDVRDVIHRAVACMAQGGVVGLATETVYGLAACALNAESVARVRAMRGPSAVRPADVALERPGRGHRLGAANFASRPPNGLEALARPGHARFRVETWPTAFMAGCRLRHGRWFRPTATSRSAARRIRSSAKSCGCCRPRWSSPWWPRPSTRSPRRPRPCAGAGPRHGDRRRPDALSASSPPWSASTTNAGASSGRA